MGNLNSGNRKDNKKKLVTDCRYLDSFSDWVICGFTVSVENSFKQDVKILCNERKRNGGKVKYFECPHCHNRVRFLYIKNNRLACRTCQDLTYESSQCKNQFNYMAKMFSEFGGINPETAKRIFRPRMKPYW